MSYQDRGSKSYPRQYFARPGISAEQGARLVGESERSLTLFSDFLAGYSLWGPESSQGVTRKFLKYREADRVGVLSFDPTAHPDTFVISPEVFDGKHRFTMMVSAAFFDRMKDPVGKDKVELQALKAVKEIVEMIDRAVAQGVEFMSREKYLVKVKDAMEGRSPGDNYRIDTSI